MEHTPVRTLVELGYVLLGLAAAIVIAWLSAWSYPLARDDIWTVAWVAMALTVAMGAGAVRRAWAEDEARRHG